MPPNKKIPSENTERQARRPSDRHVACENQLGAVWDSKKYLVDNPGIEDEWRIVAIWSFICSRRAKSSALLCSGCPKTTGWKLIAIAVAYGKCPKLLLKADKLRLESSLAGLVEELARVSVTRLRILDYFVLHLVAEMQTQATDLIWPGGVIGTNASEVLLL